MRARSTASRLVRSRAWPLALLLPALGAILAAAPARALESAWDRTEQTGVRLLSAVSAVGAEQTLPVGLQIVLEPGWKTYWRSPGDAGFPLAVDWTGSQNLAAAELAWPAPHRFTLFGLDTFGYEGEVVFPITIRPERPGEPVALRAAADYLVCEQICIPYQARLALDLPAGPALPTAHAQHIDRYRAQVPGDGAAQGLALERLELVGREGDLRLEIVARSLVPFGAPDAIVEGPPGLWFGRPEVALSDGGRLAQLRLPLLSGEPSAAGAAVTLTLLDGTRGLERKLTLGAPAAAPAASLSGPAAALLPMLLLALLGGLILNLMPCVLPVLSLKLLGVVGHGGGRPGGVRLAFLASTAGILVSFLLLAAAVAALKAGGLAVGWGIQFQQPAFLVAMVLVLTLFACNLWGWFDIPLPHWLGGAAAKGREGLAGHFLTGALATLLATPCSAPFLGTAVGFALARGPLEIFAIFAALGLGLALPYLLVAAVPTLATRLPRPGPWMMRLRRILALALVGTAVWLLTVLAAQTAPAGALLVGAAALAVAAALWARRRLPGRLRLASPALVAVLAVAAFLLPPEPPGAGEGEPQALEGLWQAFEPDRIPALVAEGKLVFVDVTADWCITCQVNKRLVLGAGDVAARLAAPEMVAMRADWTRPDDGIARYLAAFGRYGIPFNAVYGPAAPEGLPLPELLSRSAVLEAIRQAQGRG